jgi:2-dehydro-3-deoxygalactonokinase
VSCDWGTSSLRIHLLDSESRDIIDSDNSGHGCAAFYETWVDTACGHPPSDSRDGYYLGYLQSKWKPLCARNHVDPANVPVVISGMASSSIGMMELPYADLPLPIYGDSAIVHSLPVSDQIPNPVLLVSGVRHGDEVMRGEETQLFGISGKLEQMSCPAAVMVIFPGTHSKHVHICGKLVIGLNTYITGELFSVLCGNGLFRDAVEPVKEVSDDCRLRNAFEAGVSASKEAAMSNALFRIRTNRLFNKYDKQENYRFLSGLLIGYELINLPINPPKQIVLCSGSKLYTPYVHAIEHLGMASRIHIMNPEEADLAAVHGHIRIFNRYLNKQ